MRENLPGLRDVYAARRRLGNSVRRTPLVEDCLLAGKTGARSVHFKLECQQHTGSFKVRGATNKILSLSDEQKKRGVITFSTGNHGKAVAHVCTGLNIRAVVCLSEHVPSYRVEMIRAMGAELQVRGASQDEAEEHYYALAQEQRLTMIEPFDDPLIVAGQGTIALEILEDLPDADVLMVQLSGGGLLAGIAMAAKSVNPDIHVVGISLERSPAMLESLKAGRPVSVEEKNTLADSLLGGIGRNNRYTLRLVDRYVDEHIVVNEEHIKDGMFHIFNHHRMIAEGAAAVGAGALLHGLNDVAGNKVVALMSGSTVNSEAYIQTIQERLQMYTDPDIL